MDISLSHRIAQYEYAKFYNHILEAQQARDQKNVEEIGQQEGVTISMIKQSETANQFEYQDSILNQLKTQNQEQKFRKRPLVEFIDCAQQQQIQPQYLMKNQIKVMEVQVNKISPSLPEIQKRLAAFQISDSENQDQLPNIYTRKKQQAPKENEVIEPEQQKQQQKQQQEEEPVKPVADLKEARKQSQQNSQEPAISVLNDSSSCQQSQEKEESLPQKKEQIWEKYEDQISQQFVKKIFQAGECKKCLLKKDKSDNQKSLSKIYKLLKKQIATEKQQKKRINTQISSLQQCVNKQNSQILQLKSTIQDLSFLIVTALKNRKQVSESQNIPEIDGNIVVGPKRVHSSEIDKKLCHSQLIHQSQSKANNSSFFSQSPNITLEEQQKKKLKMIKKKISSKIIENNK